MLPQLIIPIKAALETRDPVVMIRTLRVLKVSYLNYAKAIVSR